MNTDPIFVSIWDLQKPGPSEWAICRDREKDQSKYYAARKEMVKYILSIEKLPSCLRLSKTDEWILNGLEPNPP